MTPRPAKENEDGLLSKKDCLVQMYNGTLKQVVDDEVNLRVLARAKIITPTGQDYASLIEQEKMRTARMKAMKVGLEVVEEMLTEAEVTDVKRKMEVTQ